MLAIDYTKRIPYTFDVVLSQYFDYEHIEHVHPETVGRYRIVEVEGNRIVYEQIWPERLRGNRRSLVEHLFRPPGEMWFTFLEGRHRGVRVHTRLTASGDATIVDETYEIPGLPDWGWLRALARPFVVAPVERIWDEDLAVEVCRDGWPGVPGVDRGPADPRGAPPSANGAALTRELTREQTPAEGTMSVVELCGREVALARVGGRLHAFDNRCPHTGGPLALGRIEKGAVVCPWHGARFDLGSGRCAAGPAGAGIEILEVSETPEGVRVSRASRVR